MKRVSRWTVRIGHSRHECGSAVSCLSLYRRAPFVRCRLRDRPVTSHASTTSSATAVFFFFPIHLAEFSDPWTVVWNKDSGTSLSLPPLIHRSARFLGNLAPKKLWKGKRFFLSFEQKSRSLNLLRFARRDTLASHFFQSLSFFAIEKFIIIISFFNIYLTNTYAFVKIEYFFSFEMKIISFFSLFKNFIYLWYFIKKKKRQQITRLFRLRVIAFSELDFGFFLKKKEKKKKREAMTPPLFFRPRQTTKRSNNDNK